MQPTCREGGFRGLGFEFRVAGILEPGFRDLGLEVVGSKIRFGVRSILLEAED